MVTVVFELGSKRVFASALEWPGWCRSAGDEDAALQLLDSYSPRYALVAERAGLVLPEPDFVVVQRLQGSMTTDFGAPDRAADAEGAAISATDGERLSALLQAAWDILGEVASSAPEALRKGPRGGGRDTSTVVAHVVAAETAYARKLGVRPKEPAADAMAAVAHLRAELLRRLRGERPPDPPARVSVTPSELWLPRYAARRIAWHVLDHAWEIQDRSS